jgi:hypothetical protein
MKMNDQNKTKNRFKNDPYRLAESALPTRFSSEIVSNFFLVQTRMQVCPPIGLPDGIFSNQIS